MRIIKPGVLPENKEIKHSCQNCKCEFAFERREATVVVHDPRDGYYLKVKCPFCANACAVNQS